MLRRTCAARQATKRNRVLAFYTIPEYEAWREAEGAVGWDIKYYKGAAALLPAGLPAACGLSWAACLMQAAGSAGNAHL